MRFVQPYRLVRTTVNKLGAGVCVCTGAVAPGQGAPSHRLNANCIEEANARFVPCGVENWDSFVANADYSHLCRERGDNSFAIKISICLLN